MKNEHGAVESCWAHKLEVHRLKLNYILLISFFGGAPALLQSKMTEMHKKKNIIHVILFSYLILFMPSHFYHSLPSRHSIFCHHHLLVTSSSSLKIFLLLFEKKLPSLFPSYHLYSPSLLSVHNTPSSQCVSNAIYFYHSECFSIYLSYSISSSFPLFSY